jgi:dipeptidyl aminopeptidase/acylaminoacyl peptidase
MIDADAPTTPNAPRHPEHVDRGMPEAGQSGQGRSRRGWWPRVRRWAVLLVVLWTAWCGTLYVLQDRLIFPGAFMAASGHEALPNDTRGWLGAASEHVTITGADGVELRAVLLNPGDVAAPTVMYFHGNAETAMDVLPLVRPYVERGFRVLVVEYRGFGGAPGRPSERVLVADAQAWLTWLTARSDVDADTLVYHGRSLGTGVATALAARHAPRLVVLESAFTSVASYARGYGVPSAIVRHRFDSLAVLRELDAPVLLLHGEDDAITPPRHARELARVARRGRLVMLAGGHNDFPRDERAFWRAVDESLEASGVLVSR